MRRRWTTHDFGPGYPKVHLRVRRVYFWTDYLRGVRYALRQLLAAAFGCQHNWHTIRYENVPEGRWWVNECWKCGKTQANATWYDS